MNTSTYVVLFLLLLFVVTRRRSEQNSIVRRIVEKKHTKERETMLELAKQFIGQECLIYTFNSQLTGTIKSVSDGAILLEDSAGTPEAVNLDYIVRIRQYPRNKKGKKKSVILD